MDKAKLALGVALVALVIAIGGYFYPQISKSLGGATLNSDLPQTNFNTIGVTALKLGAGCGDSFTSGHADCITYYSASSTIVAGTSTTFLLNNTGKTLWVTDAALVTDGTASSSFRFDIATNTIATLGATNNLSAPSGFIGVLKNFRLATSSLATSTSMLDMAVRTGANDNHNVVIKWNNGEYLGAILTQADSLCKQYGNGACETATSTNRGFNAVLKLKFND